MIQPTQITFLNGTTTMVFESEQTYADNYINNGLTYYSEILITLSPRRYNIQEYVLYQPDFKSRNLNTDIEKSSPIDSNTTSFSQEVKDTTFETANNFNDAAYNVFDLLAKIGGFCSFLKFVFGAIAGFVNNTLIKIELINRIKSKISNSEFDKFKAYITMAKNKARVQPLTVIEEEKRPYKNKNRNLNPSIARASNRNYQSFDLEEVNKDSNNENKIEDNKNNKLISKDIEYSFCDALFMMFKCFKLRYLLSSNHSEDEIKSDAIKRELLFDTDIANIVNSIKELRIITKFLYITYKTQEKYKNSMIPNFQTTRELDESKKSSSNINSSKTKNIYKTSLKNKASCVHGDKNAKSYIFPQTMTKMQTITQNRNLQKLKSTHYKNVVNSINSIISHEIEQVAEPSQIEIVAVPPDQSEVVSKIEENSFNKYDDIVDDFNLLSRRSAFNMNEIDIQDFFDEED